MPPKKKELCFVLMPFKDEMKEVYWKAIRPAASKAGFDPLRVDELKGAFNINRKIIEYIFESDAIVADLTGWNPNVFYEMGVAHAIADKTIMIIQKEEKLPFDVSTYQCIKYDQTAEGLEKLKFKIVEFLCCITEWCQEPTNPVQEFKPFKALVPRTKVTELEKQLKVKDRLLSNSVPLTQLKELQKEMSQTKKELEGRLPSDEVLAMKKEVEALRSQLGNKQKLLDTSVAQAKYDDLHQQLKQTKLELEKRPQPDELLTLKRETDKLRSKLLEKEQLEKQLRSQLTEKEHLFRVIKDEADKKIAAVSKIISPPQGMVLIPAGKFIMGSSEEQIEKLLRDHPDWKREWVENEKPAHEVYLDAFFMDQYQVTNARYAEFLNSWGKAKDEQGQLMIEEHQWGVRKNKDRWDPQPGFENHPVVNVTWYGAQQFALWAEKQLPTEAQWEKAARGGKEWEYSTQDGTLSPKLANYYDSKIGKTATVGNYPANPYGLYDMSGNVWEWCQDWFDEAFYQNSPATNPAGPKKGERRVVRGGSGNQREQSAMLGPCRGLSYEP